MGRLRIVSAIVSLVASVALTSRAIAAGLNFAGAPLTPGGTVQVSVPLSDLEKSYVAEGGNVVPAFTLATLSVPHGFNPNKPWPVLVVFSSSQNRHPSWFDLMRIYRHIALAEGWVLLAGDGPKQPSRLDSSGWRAGHTLAALDALHRSFPGSQKWPVVCAGQSGGAKRATYLAPLLAARGYHVAGIFLSGMNEERITDAYHRFQPGRDFLSTPIFFNSGVGDLVATLDQQNEVEKSMRRTGFTNIRHTTFPGGHELPPARLLEGLRWLRKGL
jgi:surfactin synthase thioesterase subunit